MSRLKRLLLLTSFVVVVATVSGCRTVSYYAQAIKGQYQIIRSQVPADELLVNPKTPDRLKQRLELVRDLRTFAEFELRLPVDGHYKRYADLHRPFVVWNVQAAPEFSLAPKTWWYPVVGRLEYRGFFYEKAATNYAKWLRAKGYDVHVGGVSAYSTLGWFKDPLLNTFVFDPDADLAETLFHELGHQRVFARGDTDFNEAFATTVGQEGTLRWLKANASDADYSAYAANVKREKEFVRIINQARNKLELLYGDERSEDGKLRSSKAQPTIKPEELRNRKQLVFEELRGEYEKLRTRWGESAYRSYWFRGAINNAKLNAVANYHDLVPGFEALLELQNGDLEQFYTAAEELAKKKSRKERHAELLHLAERGGHFGPRVPKDIASGTP